MYQPQGGMNALGIETVEELLKVMEEGLAKTPITDEKNKKTLLDSMKEIDKIAKEFAVNDKVENILALKTQEDIFEARRTGNIEKLLVPIEGIFEEVHATVSANPRNLGKYMRLQEPMKRINKAIKEGKEKPAENNDGHEEIISEASVIRMKDPITKTRITEPVKNIHCGHVYNKESIIAYINDNQFRNYLCQCPQPGCSNKRRLVVMDIEDYPEFFETAVLER